MLRYRAGDALGALAAAHTAQRGADALVTAAADLARLQGHSWTELGNALNITRQSAQGRFGVAAGTPAFAAPAGAAPPAQQIADETLHVRSFAYPVTVYRLADSTTIAVVSEVWGNPSPMNLSESIAAAVQQQWPGAHVLERWADAAAGTTPGADGHFAWSGGNGGHVPADLDDLYRRGLDLRAVVST
ncbi:MAG: hypothetical protein J0H43_06990 [Actinobacteria bacterium]|nr:hypothetical protein [Actinomycetota bacterium]